MKFCEKKKIILLLCIADFFWLEDVDQDSNCKSSSHQLLPTRHSHNSLTRAYHITTLAMPTNFSWNVIHKHLNILI